MAKRFCFFHLASLNHSLSLSRIPFFSISLRFLPHVPVCLCVPSEFQWSPTSLCFPFSSTSDVCYSLILRVTSAAFLFIYLFTSFFFCHTVDSKTYHSYVNRLFIRSIFICSHFFYAKCVCSSHRVQPLDSSLCYHLSPTTVIITIRQIIMETANRAM